MSARLILVTGDGAKEHSLSAFNTLGRHPDNTVQLLDRIVSKEHCRITRGPQGKYVLRDVGSLNGSFVNGERVTERNLEHGDEVSMGNTVLRFEEDGPIAPARNVTMFSDQVQSQVRSRVDASSHFLPAAEILDIEHLRADYEKLRIAHELSQRLSVDTDLDELCRKIIDETFQLIRADRAVILIVDPESGELMPRYVKQKREDEQITLSSSILEEVRNNKRAVLSSDAMLDERFKAAKSIIMQGIRSTMCVPMLYNDRLVGAIHMDSMLTTNAFTEKDLTLFQGIATQAAVAIENHRLAKKIEKDAETRAQFQRLLSPNVVEQIVSGAIQLDQDGSKLDVTMLFADIRGFTSMSERHTPEQMVRTLNAYFEVMVDVLFRNSGTLDKYVGDEIIGLFGAPVQRPDAPVLAVRCALEMQRALEEFNRMREADGVETVHVGIGVNTGPVIAGAIGSSRTLQYTVIGDAVNVASRLCSAAGPDEVLISQSTYELVRGQVAVEDRDPIIVKGKAKAIDIFRATGMLEQVSTPSRNTQALSTNKSGA
ncbi:MAG: FHA domain-containing protein [Deltaproteobacteria bacterium]|nr:FHA domain-containing protein [Nannocystaceae bacterium]